MTYFTEEQIEAEIEKLGLEKKTDRQLYNLEDRWRKEKGETQPLDWQALQEEITRRFEQTHQYDVHELYESPEQIAASNGWEIEAY